MRAIRFRQLCIWFILVYFILILRFIRSDSQTDEEVTVTIPEKTTIKQQSTSVAMSRLRFPSSSRYKLNLSECWTDADYLIWKKGGFYSPFKSKGSIVYMIMTGDPFLRTRCDVIMCTFGVTIHPSRLFFVGETSSDSRLPVYDVVKPGTRRPVDRAGSMQKLAQGLAMVLKKINEGSYNNEIDWIMVMDDDTFVSPLNLQMLAEEYDPQRPMIIGQSTCGVGFCGGAGYIISKGLFVQLPRFIRRCRGHDGLSQSDQFVPSCIKNKTNVQFIDRKEFNSQPPEFYSTQQGYQDRPDGFGRAVTFHYITPAHKYVALWRLQQAYI